VDPRLVEATTQHIHPTGGEETQAHPRVNFPWTHPVTSATTAEILTKIKELQEQTTKELENFIEDLLP
jgi:hypothetical protein